MSIIERVAELLGPMARSNPKSSARDAEIGVPQSGLIERALGESGERARPNSARMNPVQPAAKVPAAGTSASASRAGSPGATARTFRVDLDQLRRRGVITPDAERTKIAESFRRIKRHILVNMAKPKNEGPANLVMVTSAVPGEGKSFCSINLAISIALEMDYSVLLVDGDVAKPTIPELFGLQAKRGLMDLLRDRRLDVADVLYKVNIGKLTLLPGGTVSKNATELLASGAMRDLLHDMAERYRDRIIVFDSPPLLAASEAAVLASQMGQIVVVVEAGKTTQALLKDALGRIDSTKVAGLLLNKLQGPALGYHYEGYGYGAK
jgi:protein-tyrosine kinase